jgi:hypothetical protein
MQSGIGHFGVRGRLEKNRSVVNHYRQLLNLTLVS